MLPWKQFYRPTPYSSETKEQIWQTVFTDCHDCFCGCTEPFSHFANLLIPPDHPDRNLTIDQLIHKNYKRQLCLFGGKEEKDGGGEETKSLLQRKYPKRRKRRRLYRRKRRRAPRRRYRRRTKVRRKKNKYL